MGISTNAMLIVGLTGEELAEIPNIAELIEKNNDSIHEALCENYNENAPCLGLDYASPYYDCDASECIFGVCVARSSYYGEQSLNLENVQAALPLAFARFKEATGVDGILRITPHVT